MRQRTCDCRHLPIFGYFTDVVLIHFKRAQLLEGSDIVWQEKEAVVIENEIVELVQLPEASRQCDELVVACIKNLELGQSAKVSTISVYCLRAHRAPQTQHETSAVPAHLKQTQASIHR